VHDVRNDRDGSQFNSAERRENLEAEADASMSAFFSGMPTGAPQVNLDSVESLGRDETEVDRNIRHLNRFQNDQ
jgi:conjugal transfer mating pair stabilization protein TraG